MMQDEEWEVEGRVVGSGLAAIIFTIRRGNDQKHCNRLKSKADSIAARIQSCRGFDRRY